MTRTSYFAHRARRILPVYFLFVVAASVFCANTPRDLLRGVPYLFFLNSFPGTAPLWPWSIVWWSLATEVQFYLLLPVLAALAGGARGRKVLLVGLVVYAVCYVYATGGGVEHWSQRARVRLFASVFGRAPAFALGALAAIAAPKLRARLAAMPLRSSTLAGDVLFAWILVLLALLLQQVVAAGYVAAELDWNRWHLLEALLWSAIVLLLVAAPMRLKPLVSNRVFGALGRWSYSLYLIHVPVLWYAFASPGAPQRVLGLREIALGGFVVALGVAASAFSYRFVERPFLVIKPPAQ